MNKNFIKRILGSVVAASMLAVALVAAPAVKAAEVKTVVSFDFEDGNTTAMSFLADGDKITYTNVPAEGGRTGKVLKATFTESVKTAKPTLADVSMLKPGDEVSMMVYMPEGQQVWWITGFANEPWQQPSVATPQAGKWTEIKFTIPTAVTTVSLVGFMFNGYEGNPNYYMLIDDVKVTGARDTAAPAETTTPAETTAPATGTELPKTGSPADFAASMAVGAIVVCAGAFIVFRKRQLQ